MEESLYSWRFFSNVLLLVLYPEDLALSYESDGGCLCSQITATGRNPSPSVRSGAHHFMSNCSLSALHNKGQPQRQGLFFSSCKLLDILRYVGDTNSSIVRRPTSLSPQRLLIQADLLVGCHVAGTHKSSGAQGDTLACVYSSAATTSCSVTPPIPPIHHNKPCRSPFGAKLRKAVLKPREWSRTRMALASQQAQ
ncbi:hypothetical protein HZ326_30932 [Fusarium oxysporum f. sp. albedinis]|nr:hypothetical protein HZ326_30932 [Fusarium oxysporum f. sp. albedinis]